MKKMLWASSLALISTLHAFAQDSSGEEYELKSNEKFGYIINADDQKVEGIVKLVGTATNPWMNQKKVKFIDKAAIDPAKKSQKFKTMDADDIKEYVAIDEAGKERHFRMIKYVNKREGLMNQSGGGIGGKIKTIKNLSSTTHLAEVLVDGKITLYRLYGYPANLAVGKDDVQRAESDEESIIAHPTILFQKENGKVQELAVEDIKDLVSDCKTVKEKLASGAYKSYDPSVQEKKKSAFGKLVKNEFDRAGKTEDMGEEIFPDYNTNCKD